MKRLILGFCTVIISLHIYAKEKEISLDDLDKKDISVSQTTKNGESPIRWHVFVDSLISYHHQLNEAAVIKSKTLSFGQEHTTLLLNMMYKEQFIANLEISTSPRIAELTYKISSSVDIMAGMIRVPFGLYEYHPLYGGFLDRNETIFPTIWSDYGVLYRYKNLNSWSIELALLNGFQGNDYKASLNKINETDENMDKAIALRGKWSILSNLKMAGSSYYNRFKGTANQNHQYWIGGLDAEWVLSSMKLATGGTFSTLFNSKLNTIHSKTVYEQLTYQQNQYIQPRLRFGIIDTDIGILDEKDQYAGQIANLITWDIFQLIPSYQLNYFRKSATSLSKQLSHQVEVRFMAQF